VRKLSKPPTPELKKEKHYDSFIKMMNHNLFHISGSEVELIKKRKIKENIIVPMPMYAQRLGLEIADPIDLLKVQILKLAN
jgi:hypothetical protein